MEISKHFPTGADMLPSLLEFSLQSEDFEVESFVEKLAWRAVGFADPNKKNPFREVTKVSSKIADELDRNGKEQGQKRGVIDARGHEEEINVDILQECFLESIEELHILKASNAEKISALSNSCAEEEGSQFQKSISLQKSQNQCFEDFKKLDEEIKKMSTKVMLLGEHLAASSQPRTRLTEAKMLFKYFLEFLNKESCGENCFTSALQRQEAAPFIQKLFSLCQDLPDEDDRYLEAKREITKIYEKVESELVDQFVEALANINIPAMTDIITILTNFTSLEISDPFKSEDDIFSDFYEFSQRAFAIANSVFKENPERVKFKLLISMYHGKLGEYMSKKLNSISDVDPFLEELYNMSIKIDKLNESFIKSSIDSLFIVKLTSNILKPYLDQYFEKELSLLKSNFLRILQQFYQDEKHNKRSFNQYPDTLKRRLTIKMTEFSVDNNDESSAILMSEDIALSLLNAMKVALKRCTKLVQPVEKVGKSVFKICTTSFHFIFNDFIVYSIDWALYLLNSSFEVDLDIGQFFHCIQMINSFYHLFEKVFFELISPHFINDRQLHCELNQRKEHITECIEDKIKLLIEKCISLCLQNIKQLLAIEQKKGDFRSDPDVSLVPTCTKASRFAIELITSDLEAIESNLDGENLEIACIEYAVGFNNVICDHLKQFSFDTSGAMNVICDVSEYRKIFTTLNFPVITKIFNILYVLCNLLVLPLENVEQVISGEANLAHLDNSIIESFLQLRTDYTFKTLKFTLW